MDAAIFDLDGTLVDSLEDLGGAVNRALARRGYPSWPLDAYKLMIGDGFRNLVLRSLPETDRRDAVIEDMRAEASADYAERCLEFTRPYAGIVELLEELRAGGLPLAVLSNKPQALTLKVVQGLFAPGTFALVRGESPDFPRKPDPASALDMARSLGARPEATLYLGDSDVDMKTALGAGMVALGAAWGYRGREELLAAGAAAVLDEPRDFLGAARDQRIAARR